MILKVLDTPRPDVDRDQLADYRALYHGGSCFRERLERFIPIRPDEPHKVYAHRKDIAHYLNYAGPIVNYFLAFVFSDDLEVTSEPVAPEWYADQFEGNCDGLGMDLHVMLRERFTRAAVERRCWILVDSPSDDGDEPANRAEWEQRQLGDAYLCPLNESDVRDWEIDERGELLWAIVKQRDTRRTDPTKGRDTVTDTWTVWGREEWTRFAVTYDPKNPPKPDDDVPEVGHGKVATKGRVPLVKIELPETLWIMNTLASAQIEQTRARNALSYSLQRTCYAMRNYFVHEAPGNAEVTGPAYGHVYGIDEKVEWDAPPGDAFAPVAAYAATLKDELYRVANQMALGVDNNAAAVGRSGDSKAQDSAATIVVVKAFAHEVRETAKRVYDLVALSRGEKDTTWDVGGMDAYVEQDLPTLAEAAATIESLNIPSPTFRRLVAKRVALTVCSNATPAERAAIAKEIDTNITDEDASKPPAPKVVVGLAPDPDNDADEQAAAEE